MPKPSTLSASTQLLRSSLFVIRQNPKLLVFSLLSLAGSIVVAFLYFGFLVLPASDQPLFSWGRWAALSSAIRVSHEHSFLPIGSRFCAHGYIVYSTSIFLGTFLNVAFYREIIRAMAGETVSLVGGLRLACRRLPSILVWSLFAAVVGVFIRLLAERLGWLAACRT